MKDFGDAARAAIADSSAVSVGAVEILTSPDPLRIWGGWGDLVLDGNTYIGVGDRGLVSAVSSALGDSEQNITLQLSGIDTNVLSLLNMTAARNAPTIVHRLLFANDLKTILADVVYTRGRLDTAPIQETAPGEATIAASIETAARGLGRGGARMRSLADQALIDADDDGMKSIAFAGQVTIYWGGEPPQAASEAFAGGIGGIGGIGNVDLGALQQF